MSADLWVKKMGGIKPAVLWFTDLACYVLWQNFRLNLIRETSHRLSLGADRDELFCSSDACNLERLFPDDALKLLRGTKVELAALMRAVGSSKRDPIRDFVVESEQLVDTMQSPERESILNLFQDSLVELNLVEGKRFRISRAVDFSSKLRRLVANRCDYAEGRYFASLALRRRCNAILNHETAGCIQKGADSLNRLLATERKRSELDYLQNVNKNWKRLDPKCHLTSIQLLKALGDSISNPFKSNLDEKKNKGELLQSGLFFCYLPLLGPMQVEGLDSSRPHAISRKGPYLLWSEEIDCEYVLSVLFGFPLPNAGLNHLFGGGGIFFHDAPTGRSQQSEDLPGRIVLVRGGFGSGKTSLGLSIAASIARSGGLAIYFALEFGAEQAMFSLQRLGFDTNGTRFRVFKDDPEGALEHFSARKEINPKPLLDLMEVAPDMPGTIAADSSESRTPSDLTVGAISIITVDPEDRSPIRGNKLLNLVKLISELNVNAYPRLVVIDSLNAIRKDPSPPETQVDEASERATSRAEVNEQPHDPIVRRQVLQALQSASELGTNIVLMSEEDDLSWTSFGEDISDTVIRLASPNDYGKPRDDLFGQTFRTINISKSRYQKEHPGSHPFKIIPGKGLQVFISTEARGAIDNWRSEIHLGDADFGFSGIDKVLEQSGKCGKVVFLEGKLGTFKTQFGICFLQAAGYESPDSIGLFVSMRYDDVDIQKKVAYNFKDASKPKNDSGECRRISPINTFRLPSGNVFPEEIFQALNGEFEKAKLSGKTIRRVLLDNPGEWEDLCPLLAQDPLFANTLMNYLRRRGVRILVTNRLIAAQNSRLIRAFLEQVDTSIILDSRLLAGVSANTIRVARSPRMKHDPATYEIVQRTDDGNITHVDFRPLEAFAQFDSNGRIVPTDVRILCRRQNYINKQYWNDVKSLITSSLASRVRFEETGSFSHRFAFELSKDSPFDSLSFVEIDEFELDSACDALAESVNYRDPSCYIDRIASKLQRDQGRLSGKVVPFFDNRNCLLFDASLLSEECLRELESPELTWEKLAEFRETYQGPEQIKSDRNFFSFPSRESENWNSLFISILFSKIDAEIFAGKSLSFGELLADDNGKIARHTLEASKIFYDLVSPEFLKHSQIDTRSAARLYDAADPHSVVSFQWTTTLQQTLRYRKKLRVKSKGAQNLMVRTLPGNLSVSGEWYLGILQRSVAVPAGVKFLNYVSSAEADEDRVRLGVGLAVHKALIERDISCGEKKLSCSAYDLDAFSQISASCRFVNRSALKEYRHASARLTSVLRQIARVRVSPTTDFNQYFEGIWERFLEVIDRTNSKL